LEEHPQEAAQLEEAEEAVTVANAAISMVASALQISAEFEGDNRAFEGWMTAASTSVEREIAAEKSKPDTPPTAASPFNEQLKADIRKDIDEIFSRAFPTIFKSAA
jgi:hypothetical protein